MGAPRKIRGLCDPLRKTPTLFMIKICHQFPFYDSAKNSCETLIYELTLNYEYPVSDHITDTPRYEFKTGSFRKRNNVGQANN